MNAESVTSAAARFATLTPSGNPCTDESAIEMSIHKNQPGTGQMGEDVLFQRGFGGGIVRRFRHGLERQLGERRDVRETPVFVLQRRKTEFGKARDAGLAQRQQPRRLQRSIQSGRSFPETVRCPVFDGFCVMI